MAENQESQHLFEVFEAQEDEEGPWYIFFEREPAEGEPEYVDTPLYLKLPPEGAFWTNYLYSDDEIHGRQPTNLFERELATIMNDPSWRMAVENDKDSTPTLQSEVADRLLEELPAHEAHLLTIIQNRIADGRDLPAGLRGYLLNLV